MRLIGIGVFPDREWSLNGGVSGVRVDLGIRSLSSGIKFALSFLRKRKVGDLGLRKSEY